MKQLSLNQLFQFINANFNVYAKQRIERAHDFNLLRQMCGRLTVEIRRACRDRLEAQLSFEEIIRKYPDLITKWKE